MRLFAIGCTHFGHANIIKLSGRPFASVNDMDAAMIARWNSTVSNGDTVYHLGDFAFKDHAAYLGALNGTIIKLQGNHDPDGWGEGIVELTALHRHMVFCHYPIEEWNRWYRGSIHAHAHTHKPQLVSGKRRFNLSAEAVDYTPIDLLELTTHPEARWNK
jgi:calcineurin-like phosphoesterase family protein